MTRTPLALLLVAGGLAATPATAAAAVTCGYDAAAHRLNIGADAAGKDPGVVRSGQAIKVTAAGKPVSCAGAVPTVDNTDRIVFTDASTDPEVFTADLSGGPLAPGFSDEGLLGTPEIEVEVKAGSGFDRVSVVGGPGAETYRAGTYNGTQTRVNLNAGEFIGDADVLGTGLDAVVLSGQGGDDVIDAHGGQGMGAPLALGLTIYGDDGGDTLTAGDAGAVLVGYSGDDTLIGGAGPDQLSPGGDDDVVDGGAGSDTLVFPAQLTSGVHADLSKTEPQDTGVLGTDTLTGLESVFGTIGPDVLRGGDQGEFFRGFGGDDVIAPGGGDDGILADEGSDTVDYGSEGAAVTVALAGGQPQASGATAGADGMAGVENIVGSPFDDTLTGDAGPNVIDGGMGADVLDGAGGTDTVSYAARTKRVTVWLDDLANDGADPDTDGTSEAGEEADLAKGFENVAGGAGNDQLNGDGGPNLLTGGAGADLLGGGLGADVLDGGLGIDTITYAARTKAVAVTLNGVADDGADPDQDGISTAAEEGDQDSDVENVTGGSGDDRLRALAAGIVNVLAGKGGNDRLDAQDGSTKVDKLDCGTGAADKHKSDPSDTTTGCEQVAS
ncbi:MAG TPA: hypothetical protein VF533_22265 [Solirubrobacteraceae bacterium]|jgi:Ca2+-binding RTX toxin-like protein